MLDFGGLSWYCANAEDDFPFETVTWLGCAFCDPLNLRVLLFLFLQIG